MNVRHDIIIRKVSVDDPALHSVIESSIGYPTSHKINTIIRSYEDPFNEIIGDYKSDMLIGIIGIYKSDESICIRHISVISIYRNQGIGRWLINFLKKAYKHNKIIAETDEETVGFYRKLRFVCEPLLESKYEQVRYKCELE